MFIGFISFLPKYPILQYPLVATTAISQFLWLSFGTHSVWFRGVKDGGPSLLPFN